jgi:nucleotide-binding universal stress UspA family protein
LLSPLGGVCLSSRPRRDCGPNSRLGNGIEENVVTAGKPIVVGVDNSAGALAAARWAAGLADRLGAPLLLACAVVDPVARHHRGGPSLMNLPAHLDKMRRDADATLQQVRENILAAHPDLVVETARCVESADIALVQLSDLARLTVVGTHVDAAGDKTVIGPIALRVAEHAHGPVVVWRGAAEVEHTDAPVVVGVEANPSGDAALGLAFELASALGAPLVAVHVRRDGAAQEQASGLLAERLAGHSGKFPEVPVRPVVAEGVPALVLRQWSSQARLLVVASHLRNRVLATLLGSTSQNLLHHVTVPLLIQHTRAG